MKTSVALLFFCFVLVSGCGSARQQPMQGSFTTTLVPADLPTGFAQELFTGSWVMKLGTDDRFTVIHNGETMVEGSYKLSQNSVVFTDESGKLACLSAEERTGSYQCAFTGDVLVLTPVDDRCTGRKFILTAHPLVKQ